MTMREAFAELYNSLLTLNQAFDHLVWAINEDRPQGDDTSPVGRLDDTVQELQGWVVETTQRMAPVRDARPQSMAINRSLVDCQRRCGRIIDQFNNHLVGNETVAWLAILARDEDKQWRSWAWGVRDALEACRIPVYALNQALLRCWSELVETNEAPHLRVMAWVSPEDTCLEQDLPSRNISDPSVE